jgi:NAD(P) transhydrogenase subunit alpha
VDLAVQQGGNCALSERDAVTVKHGVTLIGHSNLPALLAADASALYARNLLCFIELIVDPANGHIRIDRTDEIIRGALVCADGARVQPQEGPRS